jgi:dTMP kinase
MIDSYLTSQSDIDDHVIHLLFAANRWEFAKQIEQDIAAGITVICDRYYYSGMIYSAAKNNRNLSLSWARDPEVGLPRPDQVIFLDLSPEEAEKRGGFGDEKYEKREFQAKVRRLFYKLKDIDEEESYDMVIIDAGGSEEEIAKKVLRSMVNVAEWSESGWEPALGYVGKWDKEH